jgi:hypothetical protein
MDGSNMHNLFLYEKISILFFFSSFYVSFFIIFTFDSIKNKFIVLMGGERGLHN